MQDDREKIEQCYGRAYLTELEHELAEDEIRRFCFNNKIKLHYYRKLKHGYQPMWREWKIEGPLAVINKFVYEFCKEYQVLDNSWRKDWKEDRHLNDFQRALKQAGLPYR
jgi:hypothetical protein